MTKNDDRGKIISMVIVSVAFLLCGVWALTIGTLSIGAKEVVSALLYFDGSREHIIVTEVRLPRVLSGMFVGIALASAGVVLQAIVNNPLASPGLFGINSGATLFVVLAIYFFETTTRSTYVWYAFAGAVCTAFLIYFAASLGKGNSSIFRIILMGAMITFFSSALTASILILDQGTLGAVQQWTVGSLKGAKMEHFWGVIPFGLIGILGAVLFERQIKTLGLGDSVARSVGQNVDLWRFVCGIFVILLAAASVALAGPVGFLGLVMPHIARLLVGNDYKFVLPCAAFLGGLTVILADQYLRVLVFASDVPVGVTMAIIGAPFFIYLARYRAGI